jgi:glycerophosphoryl diester phosphodiesterase
MALRTYCLLVGFMLSTATPTSIITIDNDGNIEECKPLVIGHRGASGYVPEHTLGSYALAITMGTDYVEPDLVMTKDGQLIARHDNELGLTTDVSEHPEFASRRRNQTVDGHEISGWFTEDFTLEEIKTLRAIERIPQIRPGNARLNGAHTVPTFKEIIDLVKSLETSQKRVIGIYPEIKHSTHFKNIGLPMERLVVDTLHKKGYRHRESPIYIQSFEITNLKELKEMTQLRLLQLYESDFKLQPYDQVVANTGYTYGDMATPEGLREVAKYAYAVGPDKTSIIPRDSNNRLSKATAFVENAHTAGLKVHPYTFRAENSFLPAEFRSSTTDDDIGDLSGEIRAYLDAGIDGLFSDQPNIPVSIRKPCQLH